MKLSVIIVNYNVKYFLEQCLDSVIRATKMIDAEIFVVDNQSSDNSLSYLTPKFPTVHFIANPDNPGFSKANNQAIEKSSGDYILLLNPDTVVGEHTLVNTCLFMDQHLDAGGIGVKMIDGYGTFLPESKRGFPSPWSSFCKIFGISKLFPNSKYFSYYHLRFLNENETHQVDVLAGAFMLLRKTALDKVGSLDETFFMYGEDIDLSYRMVLGGYKNYYLPEKIIHYKGESTKKDIRYVKIFHEAMLIFFKKHYPHYSRCYSYLIHLGIYSKAIVAAVSRLFPRPKYANTPKREVTFSTENRTYEQMIEEMDQYQDKKTLFRIYHPESGITVAANDIKIYEP